MNAEKIKLENKLWDIANTLRGKMGADDFRDYILGFIFYKYLSESMSGYAEKWLDNRTYSSLDVSGDRNLISDIREEALEQLGYFLHPSELFSVLAKRGQGNGEHAFIMDDLQTVLDHISASTRGIASEEDFEHLFEDVDLTSSKLGRTVSARNELIVKVLTHLEAIDFRLEDTDNDILGDAYEYLIGEFASGAGKKAGEFYTPQQVSKILAKIVTTGKTRLKNVYDPTCGSGSLLLRVAKEVEGGVGRIYGQESNPTTYNLCRMNMIMHGVHHADFEIKNEDTLEYPQHRDMTFEAVVANPPFSAKWSANQLFLSDDRFSDYGKLAPASKADFAFILHMVSQLADNGRMACVVPHGVLFRGAAEGHIRRHLIETNNYLDAVIGLPPAIFYGTGIPVAILVLKKGRNNSDVLFIDASREFEPGKRQNKLRTDDIDHIVATYRQRSVEDKYSYLATRDEIAENDYNLNIPRYVDTYEEEEEIDIQAAQQQIDDLEGQLVDVRKEMAGYLKELGL